jgi:hypothetical protein
MTLALFLLTPNAQAQDTAPVAAEKTPAVPEITPTAEIPDEGTADTNKNNTAHVLKIEGCEFEITLPGEPYNTRRCDPENPDDCSRLVSYTKTFGLDATVNFEISCNPADPATFGKFDTEVMKTTIAGMVGTDQLDEQKSDVFEGENFKQAMIVGTGKVLENDRLYTAQLWIGHKSLFTVEGEVVGSAVDGADKMFAEVISSARYIDTGAKKEPEKKADKKQEKPAKEQKKP